MELVDRQRLISVYSQLLEAVLHCISDPEAETQDEAKKTNLDLLVLVKETSEPMELQPLLAVKPLPATVSRPPCTHLVTILAGLPGDHSRAPEPTQVHPYGCAALDQHAAGEAARGHAGVHRRHLGGTPQRTVGRVG